MSKTQALSIVELQNLRADVDKLLAGHTALDDVVFAVKHMLLPNAQLTKIILDRASIAPGNQTVFEIQYKCRFNQDAPNDVMTHCFMQPEAILAMTSISALLEGKATRKHVIDAITMMWRPAYMEWLSEFMSRLSDKACIHFLLETPLKDTGKLNVAEIRRGALSVIREDRSHGLVLAAVELKKLPALYEMTRWEACQRAGNRAERTKMLDVDFEL